MQKKKYHPASPELSSMKDLWIKVIPNAASSAIIGWENGVLKVKVQAVPEKGRANKALVEVLAKYFEVPKRSVVILSGERSRKKRIRVEGIDVLPL
jgi:uncharacterized protein (TIGR00251 family)